MKATRLMAPLLCAAEKPKKQATEHDTRRLSQRDDFGSEQTPPKGSSKPKKVGPDQHHPMADVIAVCCCSPLEISRRGR